MMRSSAVRFHHIPSYSIRYHQMPSDAIRRALRCHQAGTQMPSPVSYEANAAELLASAAKESVGLGPMPVAE
jgi:hypothetical protein